MIFIKLFLVFFVSAILTWIFSLRCFSNWSSSHQSHHTHEVKVSRLGGLTIFVATLGSGVFSFLGTLSSFFAISICFVALVGVSDDLVGGISAKLKLGLIVIGSLFFLLGYGPVSRLDNLILTDTMSLQVCSILFSILGISALTHGFNLVDGLNGLTMGIALTIAFVLYQLAIEVNNYQVASFTLYYAAVFLGVFVINFPLGRVFIGDGGAYLVGFWVSIMSVYLNNESNLISSWSFLLLCIYPTMEVIASVVRRGRRTFVPDNEHLHSLIFSFLKIKFSRIATLRKWLNPMAAMICLLFNLFPAAVVLKYWDDSIVMELATLGFVILYIVTYRIFFRMVRNCSDLRSSS